MFDLQRRQHARGRTVRLSSRRRNHERKFAVCGPPSAVIFEGDYMDPVATLFLVLIIILVVASILIPQIQERRRRR
jgi:hypothetical protein